MSEKAKKVLCISLWFFLLIVVGFQTQHDRIDLWSVRIGGGNPWIDITHPYYGGKGDGVCGNLLCTGTDDTPALNSAIAQACAAGGTPIHLPTGVFLLNSKPNAAGCGLWILGSGNGSTSSGGTSVICNYTEAVSTNACLTWDGSYGGGFLGTGGGLQNLTMYKGPGKTGGSPIKLTGTDDSHRAGFFTISDVVVSGVGSPIGTWNKSLVIDGSCCTTPSSQGIRDIHIRNFWPALAQDGDSSILLKNAVQVMWYGGEVFPASGGGATGLTITGAGSGTAASTNIFLTDVYIVGNVVFDFSSTISFRGLIGGNFTATANTSGCMVTASIGGSVTNTASCLMVNTGSSGSVFGTTTVNGTLTVNGSQAQLNGGATVNNAAGIQTTRFRTNFATAQIAGNIALSAGWGNASTVTSVTGNDETLTFTATSGGTGQAANPTITLTFNGGTWNIPGCVAQMVSGTGTFAFIGTTTESSTAPIFTYFGTPVASSTYRITVTCAGR